jgi:hypothetical protein
MRSERGQAFNSDDESFKRVSRDPSTSLRMTVVRGTIHQFEFRILESRAAHPGNLRQAQHPAHNGFARRVLDLIDGNRVGYIETSGFGAAK